MIDHSSKTTYTLVIVFNIVIVLNGIVGLQNQRNFTNFVFQPEINSPVLPPDTPGIELIKKNGYPLETHRIITKDNYILTAYRIPRGRYLNCGENTTIAKPPVFLLHGLFQSSDVWVHNPKVENCLGFFLADAGYDVWLGNHRGNAYSNGHLFFNNSDPNYSDYSLDELGEYDVPATLKYILDKTNKPKLHFVGYSLGATHFYMAMSKHPELNDKISLHVSLAPVTHFDNLSPLAKTIASFSDVLQLSQVMRFPLFPRDEFHHLYANIFPVVCHPNFDIIGFCRFLYFLSFGFSPSHIKSRDLPQIGGQGVSLITMKMFVHILQLVKSGEFTQYDYGDVGNFRKYGQINPPRYNLQNITAPVAIIQAPFDIYAPMKSTNRLAADLKNIVEYHLVEDNEFSHGDFTFSSKANVFVYTPILKLLNKYS